MARPSKRTVQVVAAALLLTTYLIGYTLLRPFALAPKYANGSGGITVFLPESPFLADHGDRLFYPCVKLESYLTGTEIAFSPPFKFNIGYSF